MHKKERINVAIETKKLSRSFKGKYAVKNLNLHVPQGSIYGFIGQNGAGKYTTQKMICGLLHPDEGEISLYGKSGDDEMIRSQMGVLSKHRLSFQVLRHMKIG